ncbi:hypothetical protein OF83DRAFT_1086428 [Amylostereum chailletii]|nr:hypothetical protein OF83DRAFT_1086428 [Amylostereum chailletii]
MPYQIPINDDLRKPNYGPHALCTDVRLNEDFLKLEFCFCSILDELEHMNGGRDERFLNKLHAVETLVWHGLSLLLRRKEIEWHRQCNIKTGVVDTVEMLLAGFRSAFQSVPGASSIVKAIPKDPRTILSRYPLDPVTLVYVCCAGCYCLYSYDVSNRENIPDLCTFKATPESRLCNHPLWRLQTIGTKELRVPALKFEPQDVIQWVGRFLSRKGIEKALEEAFKRK